MESLKLFTEGKGTLKKTLMMIGIVSIVILRILILPTLVFILLFWTLKVNLALSLIGGCVLGLLIDSFVAWIDEVVEC